MLVAIFTAGDKDSVKKMSELNPHCKYEIWEKAAHNIPPLFAKRFNEVICGIAAR